MTEIGEFGEAVLVVSAGLTLALAVRGLLDRIALPAAALFLVAAALLAEIFPGLAEAFSIEEVERIAVVALIVILFDGGMHIGWRRFRAAAVPILLTGVVGTFATAALLAVAAHTLLGLSWTTAGIVGAALAPTDPAVTFSVLGNREIRGLSGTILQGESGANDPVGIALMIGMIEFATQEGASFSVVLEEFAIEMAVGLAVGVAGGVLLLWLMRNISLPEPALYPLRVLAGAGVIYGFSALVHGSGFIAVFVAGILVGDAAAPRKGEIEGFYSSLASLAEITAFVALGLSIDVSFVTDHGLWADGVLLAALLAFVIRPLVIGVLLLPTRLRWGERLFVMWGGLKGAVPILLAALAVLAAVDDASTIYGLVFVAVLFSVVVQGVSIPFAAAWLRVPFRRVDHELAEVRPFTVAAGALACGRRLDALPLAERAWVGGVTRGGEPVRLADDLVLADGDRVQVYCNPMDEPALRRIFEGTA
jgi:cell volume regulation protein A